MRDPRQIQIELESTRADIAIAGAITQLQTDEGFRKLQDLFRARIEAVTSLLSNRDFNGNLQALGRLQGRKKELEAFCKAPSGMQKEIQGLSKRAQMLQNELQRALSQSNEFQYQR